jgi:hypothetical protein
MVRVVPRIGFLLIAIGVLGMTHRAQAEMEVSLPDYEREARAVFQGMCDGGKISYNTYHKKGGYVLEVANIQSAGLFYFMKRYLDETGWEERYFIKIPDSSLKEFSHEEWDNKVRQASVNYFNKLHDLNTTCSRVLLM